MWPTFELNPIKCSNQGLFSLHFKHVVKPRSLSLFRSLFPWSFGWWTYGLIGKLFDGMSGPQMKQIVPTQQIKPLFFTIHVHLLLQMLWDI